MIDYSDIVNFAKQVQDNSDVEHVFIAVMDNNGEYRSLRSSELNAGSVRPFIAEVKADPIHAIDVNVEEITGSGSRRAGDKGWG